MDAAAWLRVVALSGVSAVLLGAFGAHALASRVEEKRLVTWHTASQYHLVHSCALLGAVALRNAPAAWCFTGGMLLFSGSLYALVLSNERRLGAITPIGGLLLAGGWACLAPTAWNAALETTGDRPHRQ